MLEQTSQPANARHNQRWDSFTFVAPNWVTRLPGQEAGLEKRRSDTRFSLAEQAIRQFDNLIVRYQHSIVWQKSGFLYRIHMLSEISMPFHPQSAHSQRSTWNQSPR
jgi:hypothetical protein